MVFIILWLSSRRIGSRKDQKDIISCKNTVLDCSFVSYPPMSGLTG